MRAAWASGSRGRPSGSSVSTATTRSTATRSARGDTERAAQLASQEYQSPDAHLYWRLTSLAYYLATQHNRTVNSQGVDFDCDTAYFGTLVGKLQRRGKIGQGPAGSACRR